MIDKNKFRIVVDDVFEATALFFKCEKDYFLSKSRKTDRVKIRMYIAVFCIDVLKMQKIAVGAVLNMDHSSIIHLEQKYNDCKDLYYQDYADYKQDVYKYIYDNNSTSLPSDGFISSERHRQLLRSSKNYQLNKFKEQLISFKGSVINDTLIQKFNL